MLIRWCWNGPTVVKHNSVPVQQFPGMFRRKKTGGPTNCYSTGQCYCIKILAITVSGKVDRGRSNRNRHKVLNGAVGELCYSLCVCVCQEVWSVECPRRSGSAEWSAAACVCVGMCVRERVLGRVSQSVGLLLPHHGCALCWGPALAREFLHHFSLARSLSFILLSSFFLHALERLCGLVPFIGCLNVIS